MSPFFIIISRFRSLSLFFSLSFAGLPHTSSFSLSFSCSIFQICGHDNYSKLNTLDNTETETIFAFRFRLYWLLSCDAGGRDAISIKNNLELHLGYHTCWLSYFALVCLWCGQTVAQSVYGHVITSFLGWVDLLTHGAPLARASWARELRYKQIIAWFVHDISKLSKISLS